MNSRGLTLIEFLLALALYSTVLLILIPCLQGGLQVWERESGQNADRSREIQFFFENLSEEIENAVPFTLAPFKGNEEEIVFSSVIQKGAPQGRRSFSEIRYGLEEDHLYRTVSDLAFSLQNKKDIETEKKIWIEDIDSLSFQFAYRGEKKDLFWWKSWPQDESKAELPLAVKVALTLKEGNQPWEKVFYLPDGVRKVYRA